MRRCAWAACLSAALLAQTHSAGPQVVTFFSTIDGSDQPYGLYVPTGYDTKRHYPLVISLHGENSNHRLNLRRVFGQGNRTGETDGEASRYFPKLKEVDFIVATPLARGTMGYQGIAEKDVYAVIADVKRRFSIDEDRVYLTGLSMGGGGALWLALTRPDVWAAIAIVCPYSIPPIHELTSNALNIPVKLFQGALDPLVKAGDTRAWHRRFEESGVLSEYVEYPGVRHNAWEQSYKAGAIFDWFQKHRRTRNPNAVRFASSSYDYASAYWVRFDRLTPGTLARIDAKFTGKNALAITTSALDGLTLQLKSHPMYSRTAPLAITIDGKILRSRGKDAVSLTRSPKGWRLQASSPAPSEKRPGLEGPIAHALADRHVYVYGTLDSPNSAELQARRDAANRAAEWSTPRSRLLLTFSVVADKDLADRDLSSSNLVLFGTKETNSAVAAIAPEMPMSLNPGAADYGLIYVYPSKSRYVLINSGLPWWMRMEESGRGRSTTLPPLLHALSSFGDFVVFKGALDNVIAEGRFDRNWKLTEDVRNRLRGTGAIEVSQ